MSGSYCRFLVLLATLALIAAATARAQQNEPAQAPAEQEQSPPQMPMPQLPVVLLPDKPVLEPKALEILKAASERLVSAQTMTFTAIATYESPAKTLQPLAYTTLSEVTLQRPDKLRVITPGDGPPTEFYYDGKTIMAYSPDSNMVAIDDAPPTVDEMLKYAYNKAAIYFPFDDILATDPYKGLGELKLAFVIGQSHVVGGVLTDMVAIVNDFAQAEVWIGVEDHLPRRVRVTYFNEPGNFRHDVEFSNWQLNPVLPPGTFASERAAKATRIKFESPDEKLPQPQ
ncbi:MAG TPA: DUF2092 domain-containing protein [Alphaproteobacteria bacterium]|nr:DUF2092 domain-containing protein [Alphaproteobacteria bacterium]